MTKRLLIMLLLLGLLFGGIFGYQIFKAKMTKKYMAQSANPAVTVSTIKVTSQDWQSLVKATGTLRTIKGVDVTTELAGLVRTIYFKPGSHVKINTPLIKLNDDTEIAQLRSLQASLELAKITYKRDKAQYAIKAVSKQTLDSDGANLKSLEAQVLQQKTIIAKKNITAPFTGRLGICYVNPGQYLNPGDKIVTLQSLNPIYIDFYIPQQKLAHLRLGQTVKIISDAFPDKTFKGKITTINPEVDPNTRNVEVEVTLANPQEVLLPGMFANVEILTGKAKPFLTLPQTAISYNPYGDIAFIIKDNKANQTFVTVGERRGDQIAVLKGLNENDEVVTTGQLKLKNGSKVIINNAIVPKNSASVHAINQ